MDGRMWNLIWGSIELILQLVGPSQRKEFFLEKKKVGIAGGLIKSTTSSMNIVIFQMLDVYSARETGVKIIFFLCSAIFLIQYVNVTCQKVWWAVADVCRVRRSMLSHIWMKKT